MINLNFKSLGLSIDVQRALDDLGFAEATPIQAQTIPHLLDGRDVIGQAQTGTGKTAAFAIPIIEKTTRGRGNVQSLVLCPTRELALQVTAEFMKLAKYRKDLQAVSIYGGQSIQRQVRALRQQPRVIIGTPGRVLDMIRQGYLKLHAVETVVLDEADEMLNMGFRPDIEAILKTTPQNTRQTVFFSATMPSSILELTHKYQRNAVRVAATRHEEPIAEIQQLYYDVQKTDKVRALIHLMEEHRVSLALVFCNTKWKVDSLTKRLKAEGYAADGLHGGMTQGKRDRTMQSFRKGQLRILIATDVAARGIDVNNIEAVFNFDLPKDTEFYVHRIGRTGRAGKSGIAFTFVEQGEYTLLKQIRKYPSVNLSRQELPALA